MIRNTNSGKKFLIAAFMSMYACSALAESVVLRFSHNSPPETPKAMMAERLQQLVKERIGDQVLSIELVSDAKYQNDDLLLDAVLKGDTDIAAPEISAVEQYSPRFKIFDLPFVFSSSTAAQKFVIGDFGMRLLSILKPNGLHGFGYLVDGMRQLSSNTLMVNPSDLEGLNVQVSASNVDSAWLVQSGANPVKTTLSETFESLKTGQLDGQMNVWSNIYANKIHEQQGFIVESDHSLLAHVVLMSEASWQAMPEQTRTEFSKLMAETIAYGNSLMKNQDIEKREAIIEAGKAKVYKLTVGQRQTWTEAMLPVWEKFEGEIGEGLIQAAASVR